MTDSERDLNSCFQSRKPLIWSKEDQEQSKDKEQTKDAGEEQQKDEIKLAILVVPP
jgi:hypothetical protein